jgi:N-acetylglucosaminyldiphosphoundecaprenol N-acetyl-beta-D-mannosaminyltransferase
MSDRETVRLFGIAIDNLTMAQALERLRILLLDEGGRHYVVTPNVDHVVRLQRDTIFLQAYAGAALVLADGMPLVWASRSLGRPLKMRVTGADLLPRACQMAASLGKSVFLLGGADGVAERAAHNLRLASPGLRIAGTYSPPMGFERDAAEDRGVVERINRAQPDVLAIGLGAPKQELWIARHRRELIFSVALCIGGAIDLAAGVAARAPVWMQQGGLEWLWRLMQEPRRLWKRYLVDDLGFAPLVLREWQRRRFKA